MKKLLTIIILLFAIKSYAQSYYKNLFDKMGYNTSVGNSIQSDQSYFSWEVPAQMEALVMMYEKTKDKKYAETLIKCMGNVIDRRDDLRGQKPNLKLSKISDFRGISGAVWSTNYYNINSRVGKPYAHLVHSANIVYPMARFAAMVKLGGSSVQSLISSQGGRYGSQTYSRIADDLIQKVRETLDYHEGQWHMESNNVGYYKERNNDNSPINFSNEILPFNMQSSIGRVFLQMYRATSQNVYLQKVYEISNFIKSNTFFNSNLQSNTWTYWKKDDLREDISHGGLTVSFPYECYKYKILYKGSLIYPLTEIKRYINTFTKDIYKSYLFINNGVNYNAESWNLKSGAKVGEAVYDTYDCARWLCLSEFDNKVYQLIVGIQTTKIYNIKIPLESPLRIALLAYYEK